MAYKFTNVTDLTVFPIQMSDTLHNVFPREALVCQHLLLEGIYEMLDFKLNRSTGLCMVYIRHVDTNFVYCVPGDELSTYTIGGAEFLGRFG